MTEPIEASAPPTASPITSDTIEAFCSYPFSTDEGFQAYRKEGLASIITSGVLVDKTEQEKQLILKTAEVFYFNRVTSNSLAVEDIPTTEPSPDMGSSVSEHVAPASTGEESHTLTFSELKDLIEQGKTDDIPNNKIIPEAINDAPPSESVALARKKPWENAS
ncbi:hypothetical protein FIBSPDRAFT_932175 [Athelia psychrophila]|uniref:Uncharacterized protein n=1 Tax=Athelia psychrophila TaxID=1759441 RepID=A0A166J3E9_9AGAM|nr:hypothetical protein FIBSPDRAFT_932175 [Fibularhizoctonia sp. CBS 109695]